MMSLPRCHVPILTSAPANGIRQILLLLGLMVMTTMPVMTKAQVLLEAGLNYSVGAQSNIFFSTAPGDEVNDVDGTAGSLTFANPSFSGMAQSQASLKGASHEAEANLEVEAGLVAESFQASITVSGNTEAVRGTHEDQPNLFSSGRSNTGSANHSYSGGLRYCVPVEVKASGEFTLTGPGNVSIAVGSSEQRLFREERTGTETLIVDLSTILQPDEFSGEVLANFGVSALSAAGMSRETAFDVLEYESVFSEVSGTVTITIIPLGSVCGGGPGGEEVFFWSALDGEHSNPLNWEPEGVPSEFDLAIFDKEAFLYSVFFSEARIGQAWIERGQNVVFRGGSLALTSGDPANPSLVVGNDAIDYAGLILSEGHELETVNAVIGRRELPNPDDNLGAAWLIEGQWQNAGRLVVGQKGRGELLINDQLRSGELIIGEEAGSVGTFTAFRVGEIVPGADPLAIVGNVAIGLKGHGTAKILGPGEMQSEDLVLGVEAGAEGTLHLRGEGIGNSWNADEVIAGDQGAGLIIVDGGSYLTVLNEQVTSVIGLSSGGEGRVLIEDAGSTADFPRLIVGGAGRGVVEVEGGALGVSELTIGLSSTGQGEVNIDRGGLLIPWAGLPIVKIGAGALGPNILRLRGQSEAGMSILEVGTLGIGPINGIFIDDSSLLVSNSITIGGQAADGAAGISGTMLLNNEAEVRAHSLSVLPRGALLGSGSITLTGSEPALIQGELAPGLLSDNGGTESINGLATRSATSFGTLRIIGDARLDGALLALSVGGVDAGSADRLEVEGELILQNATLQLNFINGYAPRAGDELPLLSAGTVIGSFGQIVFNGLAPGFEYQISDVDGALVLLALNDAVYDGPRADGIFDDRFEAGTR